MHDYDKDNKTRKLSKKAKAGLEEWKGDQRGKKRDSYFLGLAETAKKKFGHRSVMAGNESNTLVVGIPMPTIALEWLIVQDVLPLSVVIMLVGKWRTNKSALLYEIFRWFAKANGGGILMENETKFSPDLCSSVMGYAKDECPIIVNRCTSVENWQEMLTFYTAEQKTRLIGTQENPGPGRTIPICFAVDSVMGKSTQEKQTKITKEGSAGRNYPLEALSITEYLRATAHEIDNWPFSLVLVNHLKTSVNSDTGQTERRKPGGEFASFQESFEIETSCWRNKIDTTEFDGMGIRLTCQKNSFGVTGREIKTRMLWWDEQVGINEYDQPVYEQKTVWDWDWSTVTLLAELPNRYQQRLKDLDFNMTFKSPKGDVDCMANCKALGMGKEDWLPFHEVGAMIRNNPEILELLRTALSIKRRALLQGDYLAQIDKLAKKLV